MRILIHRKGNDFWAQKYTDSELLLAHINGGERKYWETQHNDIVKLAKAHGWTIEVKEEE